MSSVVIILTIFASVIVKAQRYHVQNVPFQKGTKLQTGEEIIGVVDVVDSNPNNGRYQNNFNRYPSRYPQNQYGRPPQNNEQIITVIQEPNNKNPYHQQQYGQNYPQYGHYPHNGFHGQYPGNFHQHPNKQQPTIVVIEVDENGNPIKKNNYPNNPFLSTNQPNQNQGFFNGKPTVPPTNQFPGGNNDFSNGKPTVPSTNPFFDGNNQQNQNNGISNVKPTVPSTDPFPNGNNKPNQNNGFSQVKPTIPSTDPFLDSGRLDTKPTFPTQRPTPTVPNYPKVPTNDRVTQPTLATQPSEPKTDEEIENERFLFDPNYKPKNPQSGSTNQNNARYPENDSRRPSSNDEDRLIFSSGTGHQNALANDNADNERYLFRPEGSDTKVKRRTGESYTDLHDDWIRK